MSRVDKVGSPVSATSGGNWEKPSRGNRGETSVSGENLKNFIICWGKPFNTL